MRFKRLAVFLVSLFAVQSMAAIHKQKLESTSVFRSGKASAVAYDLTGLRWSGSQTRERVVLDFAPQASGASVGELPYVNVELRESKYIFIDMSNVLTGELAQKEFLQQIKSSGLIKTARMTFVPRTLTMNLSLELSERALVEIATVPSRQEQPARLVLDFKKIKKRGSQ